MKHINLPVNHYDGIDLYGADKRVLSPTGMQEAVDAINMHDKLVQALEGVINALMENIEVSGRHEEVGLSQTYWAREILAKAKGD